MRWIVRAVAALVLGIPVASQAQGLTWGESVDREAGYVGGRGLITYYGQTGMFQNPTSGTAHAGDLTIQSCALLFETAGDTAVAHAGLASYAVTDWLELGVFGLGVYGAPEDDAGFTGTDSTMFAVQGNARLRLLKDSGALPELSVGGSLRGGHEWLRQQSLYIAASKGFGLTSDLVSAVRFHLGVRQMWRDPDVKERSGTIVFGGIDLSLPYDLHLVSEVSSRDDIYRETPYSVGVQWRDPRGYGLSLAYVRSDDWADDAVYIGIGVNF